MSQHITRLLKLKEVKEITGLGGSSVYRLSASGSFPSPIKLTPGGRSSAWVADEVYQWVSDRIAASRDGEDAA